MVVFLFDKMYEKHWFSLAALFLTLNVLREITVSIGGKQQKKKTQSKYSVCLAHVFMASFIFLKVPCENLNIQK